MMRLVLNLDFNDEGFTKLIYYVEYHKRSFLMFRDLHRRVLFKPKKLE